MPHIYLRARFLSGRVFCFFFLSPVSWGAVGTTPVAYARGSPFFVLFFSHDGDTFVGRVVLGDTRDGAVMLPGGAIDLT